MRPTIFLLYTGPVTNDIVDIFVTPDNVKAYESMRDLYKSRPEVYGKDGYMSWEQHLPKMHNAKPYTFVPMSGNTPTVSKYHTVKGYPEKVAIIYNRFCASSCESLLFEAQFSNKTITVGENSGGYTGYGNVMSVTTPCGNNLNWTTTRYRNQRNFDFVGIPPKHGVPATEPNWVGYAQKLLKSRN